MTAHNIDLTVLLALVDVARAGRHLLDNPDGPLGNPLADELIFKLGDLPEELFDSDTELGYCSVAGYSCVAPAGYRVGGDTTTANVVDGAVLIDSTCPTCDELVCDACVSPIAGVCPNCQDDDDDVE